MAITIKKKASAKGVTDKTTRNLAERELAGRRRPGYFRSLAEYEKRRGREANTEILLTIRRQLMAEWTDDDKDNEDEWVDLEPVETNLPE